MPAFSSLWQMQIPEKFIIRQNEEEFSAAPEVGNEDLNGFQAEISTEENDRIEAEESGEIISGAIAGDSVDSGISLFSLAVIHHIILHQKVVKAFAFPSN